MLKVCYLSNSLHLVRKEARIFFFFFYLKRSLLKPMGFEKQIISAANFPSIFPPNTGYCIYYLSTIFRNTHSFEEWGISLGFFPISARAVSHVTRLDQSHASENICCITN